MFRLELPHRPVQPQTAVGLTPITQAATIPPMSDDLKKSVTEYLAKIGKRGGKAKTAAKSAAAQANGKKGGRPRKNPPPPQA